MTAQHSRTQAPSEKDKLSNRAARYNNPVMFMRVLPTFTQQAVPMNSEACAPSGCIPAHSNTVTKSVLNISQPHCPLGSQTASVQLSTPNSELQLNQHSSDFAYVSVHPHAASIHHQRG